MTIFISSKYQQQHLKFLTNQRALYELFDKLEVRSIFTIAENSIVVDLDNITFGPERYAITIMEPYHVYHRTMYYCVLYFIFEKDHSTSVQAYQRLVEYIIESKLEFEMNALPLYEEQAKVYLLKFLNLLWGGKHRHKLIVEELKNLPQIDTLLIQLFVQITGVGQLNIESNATAIGQNIKKNIGLTFEFLSYELILFQQSYQVEVRQFSDCIQFDISHLTHDRIDQIRREFEMGQSACFRGVTQQQVWSGEVIQLMKKQTTQSIQLQDVEEWEEDEQFAEFEEVLRDTLFERFPLVQIGFKKEFGRVQEEIVVIDKENNSHVSSTITHALSFNQMINKESNESDPSTVGGQMFADTKKDETVPDEQHQQLQNQENRQIHCNRLSKNKTHTCLVPSFSNVVKMNNCVSSKNIKPEDDSISKSKFRKDRKPGRVPSFIINRMNAKQDSCQLFTGESFVEMGKQFNSLGLKITFNYCSR